MFIRIVVWLSMIFMQLVLIVEVLIPPACQSPTVPGDPLDLRLVNAEAEQRNKTASLDLKTAELKKQATILLAEGEAQSRKMVMDADGALEKKLQAYIEVNRVYAEAMAKYQGAWVPSVMMGAGDGAAPQNGAMDFINLLAVKAAKDLAIDLSIESKTAVAAAASK